MADYILAGLGNPGDQYKNSRHSVGRMFLDELVKKPPTGAKFSGWQLNKKLQALENKGEISRQRVTLIKPETFMNKSGLSFKPLITNPTRASRLIIVHDDIDLPLGTMKINFNRSSAGHKGLESIIKAIKTQAFIRMRIGVSPTTAAGKIKKPSGDKVVDFIIADFKPKEQEELKKVFKKAKEAIYTLTTLGLDKAMNSFN